MPTSVTMPALGESISEGTVTRWLKREGDRVEVEEPLLEFSTDKVDTEIPSPDRRRSEQCRSVQVSGERPPRRRRATPLSRSRDRDEASGRSTPRQT